MTWARRKPGERSAPLHRRKPALLIGTLFLMISGCASSRGTGPAETEELLGQEVKEGRVVEGTIHASPERSDDPDGSVRGYRIQVIASTIREEAEGIAEVVRGLFTVPVYVEYFEPYYRVRVGDFRNRDDAEEMRKKLLDYGFESAWTVATKISPE